MKVKKEVQDKLDIEGKKKYASFVQLHEKFIQ